MRAYNIYRTSGFLLQDVLDSEGPPAVMAPTMSTQSHGFDAPTSRPTMGTVTDPTTSFSSCNVKDRASPREQDNAEWTKVIEGTRSLPLVSPTRTRMSDVIVSSPKVAQVQEPKRRVCNSPATKKRTRRAGEVEPRRAVVQSPPQVSPCRRVGVGSTEVRPNWSHDDGQGSSGYPLPPSPPVECSGGHECKVWDDVSTLTLGQQYGPSSCNRKQNYSELNNAPMGTAVVGRGILRQCVAVSQEQDDGYCLAVCHSHGGRTNVRTMITGNDRRDRSPNITQARERLSEDQSYHDFHPTTIKACTAVAPATLDYRLENSSHSARQADQPKCNIQHSSPSARDSSSGTAALGFSARLGYTSIGKADIRAQGERVTAHSAADVKSPIIVSTEKVDARPHREQERVKSNRAQMNVCKEPTEGDCPTFLGRTRHSKATFVMQMEFWRQRDMIEHTRQVREKVEREQRARIGAEVLKRLNKLRGNTSLSSSRRIDSLPLLPSPMQRESHHRTAASVTSAKRNSQGVMGDEAVDAQCDDPSRPSRVHQSDSGDAMSQEIGTLWLLDTNEVDDANTEFKESSNLTRKEDLPGQTTGTPWQKMENLEQDLLCTVKASTPPAISFNVPMDGLTSNARVENCAIKKNQLRRKERLEALRARRLLEAEVRD